MANLKLYLLGPPCIEREGVQLDLGRRKALALFVYLAVERKAHSRDMLATLLWPDYSQREARVDLARMLSVLRKTLGEVWFVTDRRTINLNPQTDLWIDVNEFQRRAATARIHDHAADDEVCGDCVSSLTTAVALYQADFMAGFTLADSPEFDDWQSLHTHSLRQELANMLEKLVHAHVQEGEYEPAIQLAQRWLALDPLHEPTHRHLMQLYSWTGQHTTTLRQYQECKRILSEELGVEPDKETEALYVAIKAKRLLLPDKAIHSPSRPVTLSLPDLLREDGEPEPQGPIFVARKRELADLGAVLDDVRMGVGQPLFIIGGPGRGKTMLVQEFARRSQEKDASLLVVTGYCNAYTGIGDPYLPFREALNLLLGDVEGKVTGGLITRSHARRLWAAMPLTLPLLIRQAPDLIGFFTANDALLKRAATVANEDGWFQRLESAVAHANSASPSTISGQGLEQGRVFEQYTALLQAISAQRPLLFILEDLHWADTSSISLLFHLSRQINEGHILILGTYRPTEVAIGWGGQGHALLHVVGELKRHHGDIWLDLAEMQGNEGRSFVDAYLNSLPHQLSESFRQALFAHTGGHPLFTVELLRDLQERGDLIQGEMGQWTEAKTIDWRTLPAKVEGVIELRMERLEEELRRALTIASVEGETFTAEVVAHVQDVNEHSLVQRMSNELDRQHRLVTAQSVVRLGRQRLSTYRFRHNLFQRYLYDRLDEVERTYLHEEMGYVLEKIYGNQAAQVAAQLAHHFQAAGVTDKAVDYLYQAGHWAMQLSANEAAHRHFSQGLVLLESQPDTPERAKTELGFQVALAMVYRALKGSTAPEVEQTLNRSQALSQQLGETPMALYSVFWGLCSYYINRSSFRKAWTYAERCLHLAQAQPDPAQLLPTYHVMGVILYFCGEFEPARKYFEQGAALTDIQQHRANISLYGTEPSVNCLVGNSLTLWQLGFADQALEMSQAALRLARDLDHAFSLVPALVFAGLLHMYRREALEAQDLAEEAIVVSTDGGFFEWLTVGNCLRGWARAEQGKIEAGLNLLRQAVDTARTISEIDLPAYMSHLAAAYGKAGQPEMGLPLLAEAMELVNRNDERAWEPEIHRLEGTLRLMQDATDPEAEVCFKRAIETARSRKARSLELRATVSLCHLWQRQGRIAEAHGMLVDIYGWFTEGFDTIELREAKALLDELHGRNESDLQH